ncbi:MotA/TolQ/ExbB proton channel family protein [Aliikangiella coralliicola]|uniref:MotA/TolQ/ExbB proton channel family protein n=1 Tax=Aliikangiella coralliicola TaxID=2592383 RepID=A0A545UAV2_9GAMM|nr:MotA/TolQ/ExbB proton channel family protein [Aliikangiella coralliicola]TQV86602.1 MotA/TolQ/ExbB proton channel family protein [Aliikangiella coralliicola]
MKLKNILIAAVLAGAAVNISAAEQKNLGAVEPPAAQTLDELLKLVKQNKIRQTNVNKEREAIFLRDRNRQRALLNQALAEKKAEEDRMNRLKAQYEANEKRLSEMEDELHLKAGTLGEMVGVVRQVAGDTAARFRRSIVSAQYAGRYELLETLAQAKEFPQIPEIRSLWVEMQNEMTEQGKVVKFSGDIINTEGRSEPRTISRVGVFNLVSDGEYLVFDYDKQDIKQLNRQPVPRFLGMVDPYLSTSSGYAALALDPSRGNILTQEVKRESWPERVQNYAGPVGTAIGVVLLIGLLIVLERLFTLLSLRGKMNAQAKSSTPGNNPLGRIMAVYLANKDDDVENLELKLDEAVLKETPRIERGITIIKVFAAVAPLMGLLGTVTGMIETFQSITLYGTGDPKIMAGGISSALITTVLGIVAALPLILTHSVVSGISKGLIHTLEEQSTGLIAQHEEEAGA